MSHLLEIIRNNASPDWSTFPKSTQPMDSTVFLTNHKHISSFSTNHQWHPQLGRRFSSLERSLPKSIKPSVWEINSLSLHQGLVKEYLIQIFHQLPLIRRLDISGTLCSSIHWLLIHQFIIVCLELITPEGLWLESCMTQFGIIQWYLSSTLGINAELQFTRHRCSAISSTTLTQTYLI